MPGSSEDFVIIARRYLLVLNIPYFVDNAGRTFLERTWYRDLIQHLHYIPSFTLAAPRQAMPADTTTLVAIEECYRKNLTLVPLPSQTSRTRSFAELFRTFRTLWRAVGDAEIVHTGIGGWPYPLGWLASPIARLRRKKLLVVVESSPWRITEKADKTVSLRSRLEAKIYECLARYWCSKADLAFYTQSAYRNQFHRDGIGPAYITPATWVNDEDIVDDVKAADLWKEKMLGPVRFLFAGRLVPEKGVNVLLDAVAKLNEDGVEGELHVIGDGPLRDAVVAADRAGRFRLRYFEPLPYGDLFLNFLQHYHAVVVPSLSDEQPRIVFDAAARAVAVLASATDGLRPYVEDGFTGRLVPVGNTNTLAEAMRSGVCDPNILRSFAMEALTRVRGKTHRGMHAERSRIIARHLG